MFCISLIYPLHSPLLPKMKWCRTFIISPVDEGFRGSQISLSWPQGLNTERTRVDVDNPERRGRKMTNRLRGAEAVVASSFTHLHHEEQDFHHKKVRGHLNSLRQEPSSELLTSPVQTGYLFPSSLFIRRA